MSNSWPKWLFIVLLTIAALIVVPIYGFYWYGTSALPRDLLPSPLRFPPELRTLYWRSLGGDPHVEIGELNPVTFSWELAVDAMHASHADHVRIDAARQALNLPARLRTSKAVPDLRRMRRHAAEIAYLIRISREWSDAEILDTALAEAWYGRDAHGIDAASEAYFGVPARQLSSEESLALLALLKSPSYYDPACRRERFTERYRHLASMAGMDDSADSANHALSRLIGTTCAKPAVIPPKAGVQ